METHFFSKVKIFKISSLKTDNSPGSFLYKVAIGYPTLIVDFLQPLQAQKDSLTINCLGGS